MKGDELLNSCAAISMRLHCVALSTASDAQCFWQAGVGNEHSVVDLSEKFFTLVYMEDQRWSCVCVSVCVHNDKVHHGAS